MCDFGFFPNGKPPTYQTKLTSFEKNCHILRRTLKKTCTTKTCLCTQLWFPVCCTTKYHMQRKATVFFCKLKKIKGLSMNSVVSAHDVFYRALPCLILSQYNNKIPKAINTITNYRKPISATYTRTKTRQTKSNSLLLQIKKK
jgi:hypothetical protein